jgi:Reverse transcriptase (RNA-dependent DNA polymerase).
MKNLLDSAKKSHVQKDIYFKIINGKNNNLTWRLITFIDIIKALGNVNQNKLLKILLEYGIPNQIICAIYNLYTANFISVKTGFYLLNWKPINQGCPLSPLLSTYTRAR